MGLKKGADRKRRIDAGEGAEPHVPPFCWGKPRAAAPPCSTPHQLQGHLRASCMLWDQGTAKFGAIDVINMNWSKQEVASTGFGGCREPVCITAASSGSAGSKIQWKIFEG